MVKEKRPLGTTRTFDTTFGVMTYAELADKIAPNLMKLLDDIDDGKYRQRPFDCDLICDFHHAIIGNIIPDIAGKWRKHDVAVGVWIAPESFKVPLLMNEFAKNVAARISNAENLDLAIETLAYLEGEFLHIHPFQDFNGRTIRALLRETLYRLDLPIVDTAIEPKTLKDKKYRQALAEYDTGRIQALEDFWYERLANTDYTI